VPSSVTVYHGDCIQVLADFPPDSVDCVVCDPPYALGFLGKEWDTFGGSKVGHGARAREARKDELDDPSKGRFIRFGMDTVAIAGAPFQEWCKTWGERALRVLKPGGYLLAFGGTRTYHRLTTGLEEAGFEIRDCIMWVYGQGMPKGLDIAKAIDKKAGHWRGQHGEVKYQSVALSGPGYERTDKGTPITEDAQRWDGWNTVLKPAVEPIVMCRKPFSGTVADNVLRYGVGGLNVDACRIESGVAQETGGRYPANLVLDEVAAQVLDEQGDVVEGDGPRRAARAGTASKGGLYEGGWGPQPTYSYGDSGGLSRMFYIAKADNAERREGMTEKSKHPTVKPIALMAYLVRMVCPPGGMVLDPFLGSGSTAIAAVGNGCSCIGIERGALSCDEACARIGLGCEFVETGTGDPYDAAEPLPEPVLDDEPPPAALPLPEPEPLPQVAVVGDAQQEWLF
jgi:site-specific DNA-methyltransferase (adenine-specific)